MQEQAPPGRAGQEGQEDATVIVSEREMEGWPGTPGQMRIERARDAREAGRGDWIFEPEAGRGRDQAILDIERLRETGMNMEFQDWAKREFTRAMADSPAAGPLPAMREIAGEAAGEATIGLAAMNERDGRTSCSFGQLSRDPEWMGLNPALPSARGLEALVIESEDEPGRPGLVMAAPLGILGTLESAGPGAGFGAGFGAGLCIGLSQDFPPGEATVLRDILLWHGARTSWKSRAQAGGGAGRGTGRGTGRRETLNARPRRGEEDNPHLARARRMCTHLGEIAREAREIQEVIEHVLDNHLEEGFVYPDNPMKRVSNIRESLASIDALAKQALRPVPEGGAKRKGTDGRRR